MAPTKRKPNGAIEVGRPVKKQKNNQVQEQKSSVLTKEEPAFPRGGASVLTPLEHRQIQIQAKQDVLFEQSTGRKATRYDSEGEENLGEFEEPTAGPRKPRGKQTSKSGKRAGEKAQEKASLKIEGLSFKRLVPGSIVLGQVTQINRYDISLALPNNLTGYIPLTAISDKVTKDVERLATEDASSENQDEADNMETIDLKSFISVGQFLRAYVVSTSDSTKAGSKGKKHLELSINPRQANDGLTKEELITNNMVQAAVVSVEDHGLIMDLGVEDQTIRGFMSSRETGLVGKLKDIHEGAVFLCLIIGLSSNGKTIKLSRDPHRVGNLKKTSYLADAPSVNVFLPGTAVELLISEVSTSGVAGKVMGLLDATADLIHSGAAASGKPLDKKYAIGSKAKARVICTFPTSEEKKIGVSFLDHVISMSSDSTQISQEDPVEILPISTIIEEARVAKVESGVGLFVDIGIKGIRGFVHISRISDGRIETLSESSGAYKLGSVHRGRIVGYNAMDRLFLLSLEKTILDLPFLRLEDVCIGQIVKGTIEKLVISASGMSGIIVKVTESISGLVPEMHFADIHLQHPEKKFKEGLSVTTRVLSINLEKRQMRLTLKKSLINSEASIWNSYENLSEGMQAPGTIINILQSGAVVQFYGSVRGFLPVSQMSESYIQDPEQHFRIGQVVNVRIISVDSEEGRMMVSCKDPSVFDAAQDQALKDLKVGSIVTGTITEKTSDQLVLELGDSNIKAVLVAEHLTDGSTQKSLGLFKKLRVGQMMQDLVVISKNETKRTTRISSKPSLVKAVQAGKLLTSFPDVMVGNEVAGFVKNVTLTGAFVEFPGNLTGLLLKSHMSDEAIRLPEFGLRRNQSISARVLSVDNGQERFLLTQKPLAPQESTDAKESSTTHILDRSLTNPADSVSTSIDDFTLGKLTKAKIMSIKDTQMNVQLADGVQGRIDVSEVFDAWEDIKDRKHPLKTFRNKQIIPVRVLGIHDSRNHRFLPITHNNKAPVFELSAKPKNQTDADLNILTLSKVKPGSTWLVFVNNIAEDCLWVNLSPNVRGRIRAMDISDDVSFLDDLTKNFPIGSALRAHVLSVDDKSNRLDLSARSGASSLLTLNNLSKGMVLPARVTKVTERQIIVQLSDQLSAPVHLIDLADDYSTANPTIYQKNQTIRVCIIDIDVPNKRIALSTRPSKVLSSSLSVQDPEITSIAQLKVNDIVRGFIKNVADNGIFVSLASQITAFVRVSELSDSYIKDWKSGFVIDQLVKGKVITVDPSSSHIQLSLKESVLDKNYTAPLTYADVEVGQVLTGKVRKVEDFGVFIVIDNSANVSGLCHRSEIAEERVEDVRKLYEERDLVKAKVLKIDLEKRRISLGLKASYFEVDGDDHESEDEEDHMKGVELTIGKPLGSKEDDDPDSEELNLDDVKDIDSEEESQSATIDQETTDLLNPADEAVLSQGLNVGGFDWSGGVGDDEDQDMHSDIDGDLIAPKKKKRRKAELTVDRTGDLDANGPQSVADFERLLMGQPNSSYLWLSYMAFELQLNETSKARDIAERAIKMIRQGTDTDSEVLNIWVAYLNLENTYGSDETIEQTFKRACEYNDPEEMYSRLTSIYIQSGKNEKADTLLQAMVKKFSQDPKIWLNYATFLFDTVADAHKARDLLPRALQSLPKHFHLDLTSKFAQLEFRSSNGDPERGRTIFEGLITTFPKRLDLWNVLLDLEIKVGDKEQVRRLFGRVTASGRKLKARKAKYFFKRWLEYEEREGDEKSCEKVKARAAEYVKALEAERDAQ